MSSGSLGARPIRHTAALVGVRLRVRVRVRVGVEAGVRVRVRVMAVWRDG